MKNLVTKIASSVAVAFATIATAHAAPVDLSTWKNTTGGSWNVAADKNSVFQTTNGNPTIFYNDENSQGKKLSGTIKVETSFDDDYVGFVLGYKDGDLTNPAANYLLIDWKQGNQNFFGCSADAGLSISQVSGVLANNSGAWCHDPANNVTELARATTLGATGWADNTEYKFDLVFTANLVQVFVNDLLELSINGTFMDGSFGFYNYSQERVRYAGITEDIAPAPVPVPGAALLMATALGGIFAARRKK